MQHHFGVNGIYWQCVCFGVLIVIHHWAFCDCLFTSVLDFWWVDYSAIMVIRPISFPTITVFLFGIWYFLCIHRSVPWPFFVSLKHKVWRKKKYFINRSNFVTVPIEMPIVTREHFNRWYSAKAYYCALTFTDFPLQFACVLIYTVKFQVQLCVPNLRKKNCSG